MTTISAALNSASAAGSSRFLSQLRDAATRHGYAEAAAGDMVAWCRRFILFHAKQHPQEMGRTEVGRFLDHVAQTDKDALRAIAAARGALEFVYAVYLQKDLEELPWPSPPRLLDQVMQAMRVKHYARTTEECYVQWIRRFILFHGKRHPCEMGKADAGRFLEHLG